jgi:hypothetical protein
VARFAALVNSCALQGPSTPSNARVSCVRFYA